MLRARPLRPYSTEIGVDVVCVRAYKRGPLEAGMSWGLLVEKVEKVGRDARAAALGRHLAH